MLTFLKGVGRSRSLYSVVVALITIANPVAPAFASDNSRAGSVVEIFDRYCLETGGKPDVVGVLAKREGLKAISGQQGTWNAAAGSLIAAKENGQCIVGINGLTVEDLLAALKARRPLQVVGDGPESGKVFMGILVTGSSNNAHEVVVADIRSLSRDHVALVRTETLTQLRFQKDGALDILRARIAEQQAYESKPLPTLEDAKKMFVRYCLKRCSPSLNDLP